MDEKLKNMMGGAGMPMGIGDPNEDPSSTGKLARVLEAWKQNPNMIPQKDRYQYPINARLLNTNKGGDYADSNAQQLEGVLNNYMKNDNGQGMLEQMKGQGQQVNPDTYKQLLNKGLWQILKKDPKNIDQNDIDLINTIQKFMDVAPPKTENAGYGASRYYFNPVEYLTKAGLIDTQKRTDEGGLLRAGNSQ